MKYNGPKTKRARRIGEALRDKDQKLLQKRNYPPGQHGQGRRRISEYGQQLREKQKAKWIYNLTEKQFHLYYVQAEKKKGLTPQLLLESLEMRLDNVVYRLGLAESRAQARQIVGHGFIAVNGKRVNIPSYQTAVGDEITVMESKQNTKYIQTLVPKLKDYQPQEWLSIDSKAFKGKVLASPTQDNTGSTIQMQLISELYSR
jgi:small subunit ribosomal protein S4